MYFKSITLLFSTFLISQVYPQAAQPGRIDAEQFALAGTYHRDPLASGEGCVAASLTEGGGTLFRYESPEEVPPGFYRATFHLRLSSFKSAIITGLSIQISCGEHGRTLWPGQFLEPDQYTAFNFLIDHREAAPLSLAVTWSQTGEFYGKAYGKEVAEEVKVDASGSDLTAAAGPGGESDPTLMVDTEDDTLKVLKGGGDLKDLASPYLALDQVDFRLITDVARIVKVWPNKIRYAPGEGGWADLTIHHYQDSARTLQLRVSLVKELDETLLIWESPIEAPPRGLAQRRVNFQVGTEHFGRGLRAELIHDGKVIDAVEEPFGVASHAYEISIWGQYGPGNTAGGEELQHVVGGMRNSYANIYECFAWAPCDFYEASPDADSWYSGQNTVPYSKRSLQRFHELCHEKGIQAVAYYALVGRGAAGLEPLRIHPEWFSQAAIGIGTDRSLDVDAFEHWIRGDYEDEDGKRLSCYQGFGVNASIEAVVRHGAEELARSSEMFGWDGVRYDGHFIAGSDARSVWNDQLVRSVVTARHPRYAFGYNAGWNKPVWIPHVEKDDRYVRSDPLTFVQICSDGGLIMNEGYRGFTNRNYSAASIETYVKGVSIEARAVRRAGGYLLGFFFDKCSPSDQTYNAAIQLASGARPLSYSWNGGAAASWPRFVTRYSAYYWDNELFEILDAKERVAVKASAPVWFDRFCYRRPRGKGRGQYVVHLIPQPQYRAFNDLLQEPAPVLKNVSVSLQPDEGWRIESAWALTPCEPELTCPLVFEQQGPALAATLPRLTIFGSVVFNAVGPEDQELPVQRLPPIDDPDPGKRCWMKVEALRAQGYLVSATEEQRAKELEGLRQLGLPTEIQGAGGNSTREGPPRPPVFRKVSDRKKLPPPEGFERPGDPSLRRNRYLDVRLARGLYNWMLRVDEALGRCGGAEVTTSFVKSYDWTDYPGKLTDMPWTYDDLLGTDVVILNNVAAANFDAESLFRLRDFVEQGGGLLILGGYWSLGKGAFQNSALEDILPVNLLAGAPSEEIISTGHPPPPSGRGLALEAGPAAPAEVAALPWKAGPRVRYLHQVEARDAAQVWVRAGERPMLVTGSFGQGRVAVWAGTVHGLFGPEETPFWEWHGWPALLAQTILWLGQSYTELYEPKALTVSEDEVLDAINNLKEESPDEFKKRVADFCGRADPDAAAFLLTAHGDEVELTEEQIAQLVERVRPGTSGLVPSARRFLESAQPSLLSVGVRLLGLSDDRGLEEEVAGYLDAKIVEVAMGAALALAHIGSPRSLPALSKKTEELEQTDLSGEEMRRLYHRVLIARHRLGEPEGTGKLASAAMQTYGITGKSWRNWAYASFKLRAGGFRLTARERAGAEVRVRNLFQIYLRWGKEYQELASALTDLRPAAANALAGALKEVEGYPALGLVHRIAARANEETLRGLMPLLGARMLAVAAAVARKAGDSPNLREILTHELLVLSRSEAAHHRKCAALHADMLLPQQWDEVLSRLCSDPDKEVQSTARLAKAAHPE